MAKTISKEQAIELVKKIGIKLGGDYHANVTMSQGEQLAAIAKLKGYKKPKSASGSTGRYFYDYLSK